MIDIQVFDEKGNVLLIKDVLTLLKVKLEVNAGRLVEPLLKEGKLPKDDNKCHEAFLVLAHLEAVDEYIKKYC